MAFISLAQQQRGQNSRRSVSLTIATVKNLAKTADGLPRLCKVALLHLRTKMSWIAWDRQTKGRLMR